MKNTKKLPQGVGMQMLVQLGTFCTKVLLRDIRHGQPCKNNSCPLALSLQRFLDKRFGVETFSVFVGSKSVELSWCEDAQDEYARERTQHISYSLSDSDRQFISTFDRRQPVNPRTVRLMFSDYQKMLMETEVGISNDTK